MPWRGLGLKTRVIHRAYVFAGPTLGSSIDVALAGPILSILRLFRGQSVRAVPSSISHRPHPVRGIAQHVHLSSLVNDGARRRNRQPMLHFRAKTSALAKNASGNPTLREL